MVVVGLLGLGGCVAGGAFAGCGFVLGCLVAIVLL